LLKGLLRHITFKCLRPPNVKPGTIRSNSIFLSARLICLLKSITLSGILDIHGFLHKISLNYRGLYNSQRKDERRKKLITESSAVSIIDLRFKSGSILVWLQKGSAERDRRNFYITVWLMASLVKYYI
jgi:hypothetical protein